MGGGGGGGWWRYGDFTITCDVSIAVNATTMVPGVIPNEGITCTGAIWKVCRLGAASVMLIWAELHRAGPCAAVPANLRTAT